MDYAAPLSSSSELINIMKRMRSYLDACSNGEMNNKMDDIEQFVDNLMLKKTTVQRTEYQQLSTAECVSMRTLELPNLGLSMCVVVTPVGWNIRRNQMSVAKGNCTDAQQIALTGRSIE
ncbi:hypothetical protein TNCV_2040631 [Trichonephila clavipes]|nr:hypothetical protein TNCV_2040631 [Trichonephila clavipes]